MHKIQLVKVHISHSQRAPDSTIEIVIRINWQFGRSWSQGSGDKRFNCLQIERLNWRFLQIKGGGAYDGKHCSAWAWNILPTTWLKGSTFQLSSYDAHRQVVVQNTTWNECACIWSYDFHYDNHIIINLTWSHVWKQRSPWMASSWEVSHTFWRSLQPPPWL